MFRGIILIFCWLLAVDFAIGQQVTVIANLHDTLQPKVVYLSERPTPSPSQEGKKPKVTTFQPNLAQGKAFFTTYDSDAGLAMDAISYGHKSSICDSDGNIWFATQGGGVSKYDGKSFINFTVEQGLANNSVFSIAEDKSGNLWFGTYGGGVSKYDGKSFINFTVEQGLANNSVFSIAEDKSGNLWFGTDGGGVSKYDGKSFINFTVEQGLANNYVLSIAEDKSGNLWFGTSGGVSKYDGKSFINFTVEQGLANNSVRSIAEDKSGNLWFGTSGGVSKYDGKSFINFTVEQGLANNSVFSIAEDKSGNLWFGTYGGGVSKYDGKSFINFTVEQGLANNSVFSIAEDKSGNLWFGTYGGGVSKYDGKSFINFTVEQGLANNSVLSIAEDKSGNLWFGTSGGGVSKYDGKSFINFTVEQGLANNSVFSIAEDKSGNLWFGTSGGGVSKYDGKSFINFTVEQGLANNSVRSIAEDKSGNLWFGTYGGVSKYDGKSFINFTVEQGLANNYVLSIAEDKSGNLWFGTSGGVSKYDGKSFINFTVEQGLANNSVRSIAEDKSGNLWFGTYGGGVSWSAVSKLTEEKIEQKIKENKLFTTYTTHYGLPDNGICALRFDNKGRLIVGTNFGLAVVSAEEVERMINGSELKQLDTYNQFTGYPIRDVNTGQNNGTMHIDSKGILWVGHGSNGVARVDLDAVNKSSEPPKVVINKVRLKGEDVCYYSLQVGKFEGLKVDSLTLAQQEVMTYGKLLSDAERDTLSKRFEGIQFDGITKFYPLPENLVLPYEHNALTFEFNAIETGRNFLVNYQYALHPSNSPQGENVEWSPITKKGDATFNNLWEGEYTFLLKAESPWGVWSEPVEFRFTVLPPWYRTWWAYTVYLFISLSVIWLLIQLQTKRLKERQKELETEVANATVEIREQKQEAEKQRDEAEEQKKLAEEQKKLAEEQKKLAEEQRVLVEQKNEEVERAHEELAEHHKEIQDSINYAKRIQEAIMPSIAAMDEALKNGFVLYEPKDVVAGDFFWMEPQDNVVYYAAADCTGHGVPGAMVSVVCSNALTKSLLEEGIKDTGKLLDRTRDIVIERLAKSGEEVKDGMDISLCALNMKTKELKWAGANNPLWILRKGAEEFEETKADKQPIGKYAEPKPFTEHTIQLNEGDTIYTFTDGYQDQFGGPKGKKFKAKQFKQILLDNQHLTLEEQHKLLVSKFRDWQGDQEQVDDVCVIGVRI